ncbi:hypothetical protein OG453_15740 [Streptomyces sp. NBC_01381]|nr:hypothetical protein [Streptomyces sp. NBC_01381]MCX4668110.1 hypothetical protein [Streptomyces sp. NBC_01381]
MRGSALRLTEFARIAGEGLTVLGARLLQARLDVFQGELARLAKGERN